MLLHLVHKEIDAVCPGIAIFDRWRRPFGPDVSEFSESLIMIFFFDIFADPVYSIHPVYKLFAGKLTSID